MKATLLVIALALVTTLGACGKKNDAPILQHEAASLAKYYVPKLDAIDQRIQDIMKRGQAIPATFPGVKEVGLQLQEARDMSARLRGIVASGPGDQKSAVEKQAEAAAKEGNLASLRKLVHDTEQTLDHGVTVILANLEGVESWLHHYDHKTLAMAPPAKPDEQAGQPPAAAEQGSAAPVPPAPPAPQPGAANKPNAPAPGQIK